MEKWPPVTLGINAQQLDGLLQHSLRKARERGVRGADKAQITTSVVKQPQTVEEAVQVHITGIEEDEAKALWRDHIKPMTKQLMPSGNGFGKL